MRIGNSFGFKIDIKGSGTVLFGLSQENPMTVDKLMGNEISHTNPNKHNAKTKTQTKSAIISRKTSSKSLDAERWIRNEKP